MTNNQLSWLYSTTYWTKTGIPECLACGDDTYFVDTLGYACDQHGCKVAIGAGARPVIKMDDMFLDYSTATENGIDS